MTKSLVIVESPSKAKTIQKYLGQGYTVLASGGHVCDLPQKTLGIDVEHGFEPEYEINPEKKETIRRLKTALKQNAKYLITIFKTKKPIKIAHKHTNMYPQKFNH